MYVESRICNYSLLSRLRNMQGEHMFAARVVIAISRMCFLIKTKVVVIQKVKCCECAIKCKAPSWWINMANSDESHSTRRTQSPTHNSRFFAGCPSMQMAGFFGLIFCWQDARSSGSSSLGPQQRSFFFLQHSLRQLLYILSLAPGDNEKHSGARAPSASYACCSACAANSSVRNYSGPALAERKVDYTSVQVNEVLAAVFITRLPGFAHSTPGDESFKRIRVEQSPLLICTFCLHNILFKTLLTGWTSKLNTIDDSSEIRFSS
jgi:hypothetical protein